MLKKLYTVSTAVGLSALPFIVLAQTTRPPAAAGPVSAQKLLVIFENVLVWFETFVWIIAVLMILVAAFQFLTAAGNEEKVTTARKSLIWGLVGIAVALFARVATTFVGNVIGGSS